MITKIVRSFDPDEYEILLQLGFTNMPLEPDEIQNIVQREIIRREKIGEETNSLQTRPSKGSLYYSKDDITAK